MARSTDEMVGQIIRAVVREEVGAALDARGVIGAEEGSPPAPRPANAKEPPAGLDPFDRVGFALYVLRQAGGGPLHASVIAERMFAAGYRHRRAPKYRDQLVRSVNSLASPSQHPDLFKRAGPRTLELV